MHAQIQQFAKSLRQLDHFLEKATTYAAGRKFDVNVLAGMRLAPDQHELARQVQMACDSAKLTAARCAQKEVPKHPDTEKTFAELRARIASVLEIMDSFTPQDFHGAEDRLIRLPMLKGKAMRAADYVTEFAFPNFYFHVTTAYAILRHNGVELGKMDYIGTLSNVVE